MPRTLITNRRLRRGRPALVGVGHHAGVAQRGAFDGVLAGERRAQQQHSRRRRGRVGVQAVGESRACRRKVPIRSRWRASNRVTTSSSDDRTSWSSRARMRASTAPARESWCSKPSCPGTKSRVIDPGPVRRESLRAPRRRARRAPKSLRDSRKAPRVLQGRDHRQRRLGALVAVRPVGVQAVEAAAGLRVPHDAGRRRCRPGTRRRRSRMPSGQTGLRVDGRGAGARVGEGGHLDRLLIEARAGRPPVPRPADRGDRQVAVGGLVVEQPLQQVQAALAQRRSSSATPAAIIASGEDRVGVGQTRLRPGPVGVAVGLRRRRRRSRRGACVPPRWPGSTASSSAAPRAANAIARGHGDRPGRHARTGRRPACAPGSTSLWAAAVPSPQMHRPQQSSTVGSSCPVAVAVHPVAAGAVEGLRVVQEPHGLTGEAVQSRPRSGSRVATTRTLAMSSVQ